MTKYSKTILVIIIGLLLGLIIHGIIEISVILLLTDRFKNLFLRLSWETWVLIHHIFSVIIEILGVVLSFLVYKKFEKV